MLMAESAKGVLTGRKLLNIEGPYGLGLKVIPLQDGKEENGIITSNVVPMSLIHKTFTLSKRDLAASERDGMPINTSTVAMTAIDVAMQEDSLIFNGIAGVPGILSSKGAAEFASFRMGQNRKSS